MPCIIIEELQISNGVQLFKRPRGGRSTNQGRIDGDFLDVYPARRTK